MKRLSILCACVLAACVSDDNGYLGDDGFTGEGSSDDPDGVTPEFPVDPEVCQKMDILFVIDDSGSMSEEQSNLSQNFPEFINVLDSYMADSGVLDYRVGVTTTGRDVDYVLDISKDPNIPFPIPSNPIPVSEEGDNGALRQDCGMNQRWLDRGDPNLSDTFSCVANVGTGGPGLEMPLYTTQLALDARMTDGTNSGFLREDSLLGIVILTDEDDCSRTDNNFTVAGDACGTNNPDYLPVGDTIAFLDELTGARGRWATAVIAGETTCSSSFGDASEAANLKQFVQETGENAVFSSICSGDLATPLQEAIATFQAACKSFDPID